MSGSMNRSEFADVGSAYRKKILELLEGDDARKNVDGYLNLEGAYAASSFDTVGENPSDTFTDSDLLALGFLNTPVRAMSYRQLQARRNSLEELLRKVPDEAPLWKITPAVYEAADSLYDALREIGGFGPTRVSKLMARKRPILIPILDSRVKNFFDGLLSRPRPLKWCKRPLRHPHLLRA